MKEELRKTLVGLQTRFCLTRGQLDNEDTEVVREWVAMSNTTIGLEMSSLIREYMVTSHLPQIGEVNFDHLWQWANCAPIDRISDNE